MERLRLRAEDADDLCVIAAVLQDARVPINEMVFDRDARCFMAALRRYRRERTSSGAQATACLSVLRVDGVTGVRWRGLEPGRPRDEHVVLTLLQETTNRVLLVFQGGEAIRLEVDQVDVHLEDFEPCDAMAEVGQ